MSDRPPATPEEIIARLEAKAAEFAAFVASVPPAAFTASSGDAWSIAEITGHAAEFPATFAAHALRLSQNPGATVGRFEDDSERLAAINRLAGRGPGEAADLVLATAREAAAALRTIPNAGWQVEGTRVVNSEQLTVRTLIERFVVGHLGLHLAQAREAAGTAP